MDEVKKIGLIGTGSMGSMMALLFAELDIDVHFFDPSDENANDLLKQAYDTDLKPRVHRHNDYVTLCGALVDGSQPRFLVFSLPHGPVIDKTIECLRPHLAARDVIMDASNELWLRTERRQRELRESTETTAGKGGPHLIGMGVSGGYQSARHGPSISPGGEPAALDTVFPFLQKVAARDLRGRPCVVKLGPGGCGHYIKMIHNGIEQGMMTVLCEIWSIMSEGMGMHNEEIGDVFEAWSRNGKNDQSGSSFLRGAFLIAIGADICRKKDRQGNYVLQTVKDKIVQDVTETEGTGTWTLNEAARLHVPAPTIAAAHLFRCATAYAGRRAAVNKAIHGDEADLGSGIRADSAFTDSAEKAKFLEDLQRATLSGFLLAFVQGLQILARADEEQGWGLVLPEVLQLWRGGCIIQSDEVVDLLEDVYRSSVVDRHNLLAHPDIAATLRSEGPAATVCLKRVVVKSIEMGAVIPALGASLEYCKYMGAAGRRLPNAQFQESQLDYFGAHMFDYAWEDKPETQTGTHHFEWKPARSIQ